MATIQAAIYCRISSDKDGEAAGVARQEADSRELAERLGWDVAHVYIENDTSAYQRKRVTLPDGSKGLRVVRPQFRALLDDLSTSRVGAVIVYDLDRVARDVRDLEDLIDCVESSGAQARAVTGSLDLSNDSGVTMARILVVMAAKSSRDTSRRVTRALEDRADAGKPSAGGIRPYGFERSGSIIPDEAEVIRRIANAIVEGQTLGSIAAGLNDDNVPTVSGVPWQGPSVRRVVTKPRTAGLLEQRGDIIGETEHGGILTPREREDVMTALDSRSTGTNQLRFWLTGVLVCVRCGAPLTGRSRGKKRTPVYICAPPSANPEIKHRPSYHPGCGGISIVAPETEAVVAAMIVDWLALPDVRRELRSGVNDQAAEAARAELVADQDQLDAVALMFAQKEITASEFRVMRREIAERISRWNGVVKAAQPSILRGLQDKLSADAFAELPAQGKQSVAEYTFPAGIGVSPFSGGVPATRLTVNAE